LSNLPSCGAEAVETKKVVCALFIIAVLGLISSFALYQTKQPQQTVVIYTSVDQVYSEPILKDFEKKTGIKVLAVYDVEATKTTGLVNRLIAEKSRPQADVFWSGEFVQTLLLKQEGVLSVYRSPAAGDIPAQYVDPDGYWTSLGARARVLLVNTKLVSPAEYPKSIFDLLGPAWSGDDIGMPYPLFGTSATQAAALYAALGADQARDYYVRLKSRGLWVVDGNSVVRDLVASGQLRVGFVDSDDGCKALRDGAPVAIIFPDQEEGGLGSLIIPNTLTLIANASHPREGQALIDYLLAREVEQQLVAVGWIQISLHENGANSSCADMSNIKYMYVRFPEIFAQFQPAMKDLSEIFIQ
jgi:iron(III) transport system substrate-binding protein